MLHTIKQLKGVLKFDLSLNQNEAASSSVESFSLNSKLEGKEVSQFLQNNFGEVRDWILLNRGNDLKLTRDEAGESWDELESIVEEIGLDKAMISENGIPVKELLDKLNEYARAKIEQLNTTSKNLNVFRAETLESLQGETSEVISNHGNSFLGIKLSESNRTDYLKNINTASFKDVLNHIDFDINKVLDDVRQITFSNGKGTFVWGDSKSGNLINYLSQYGYAGKHSRLGSRYKEAAGLVTLLSDIQITQDKINSGMSSSDKLRILFDFDTDGVILERPTFNMVEVQGLLASRNETQYNNMLVNLGYNPEQFEQDLRKNYFATRENFKTSISRFLEMSGTSANQLLLSNNDFNESNDYLQEQTSSLREGLSSKLDSALAEKGINVNDEVKRSAINLMIGDLNAMTVSFDSAGKKVSDMTRGILDNVSFGFADGKIGLIIGGSRQIFNGRATVGGGLANFVPYFHLNGELYRARQDTAEQFMAREMKTGVNVSGGVNVTPLGLGGNLSFDLANEQTDAGIRRMVESFETNLDEYISFIKDKKTFEQTGIPDEGQNKVNYERLFREYATIVRDNVDLIPEFKASVLRAYRNELYKNAQGTNLSGITLGVLGPIVYIGPKFQRIKQQYISKDTTMADEWIRARREAVNERNQRLVTALSENITLDSEITGTIETFNSADILAVKDVNSKLSLLINQEIIKKLERTLEPKINKLLKGEGGKIEDIYNELIREIETIPGNNSELIVSLKAVTEDSQKILILQNVAINLMKKEGLNIQDNTVTINSSVRTGRGRNSRTRTINSIYSYDGAHNRATYFNNIFKKEFPALAGDIITARASYYTKYGALQNYTLRSLNANEGIAMAGVQVGAGRGALNTINPYVTPNIADFGKNGNGKIEFSPTNRTEAMKQMVAKLPEHFILPMINQLTNLGYNFVATELSGKVEEFRNLILNGGKDGLTITNKFYFTKAGECLNDMILMDFEAKYKNQTLIPGVEVDVTRIETPNLDTYVADNKVTNISITGSRDTKPKPDTGTGGDVETTPGSDVSGRNNIAGDKVNGDINQGVTGGGSQNIGGF